MLDHVGARNWHGSISGTTFRDDNADGVPQSGELLVGGVTVVADLLGDATNGYFVEQIEPNRYAVNSDLSNISENITIVSAGSDNVHQGFKIRSVQRFGAPAGEHIFAHEGVGFFNENRRLRMDFYRPAKSISIDVIGNSDLTPTYGRLELFSASGTSLGFVRTNPLGANARQRLTLVSPSDNIAWAIAYSEDSYLNSSPFGMLDDLSFQLAEIRATSDLNGNFRLAPLTNATYTVRATPPLTYDQVFPIGNGTHTRTVSNYESVRNVNFGYAGNRPPTLADQSINVLESHTSDLPVADLPIVKGYPSQQFRIMITAGDPSGLFHFETGSNQLKLTRSELDFEKNSAYTLQVRLEDLAKPELSSTASLNVAVVDVNEPPTVASKSATLAEHAAVDTAVATMTAVDLDVSAAGEFDWSIVSGNADGAFAIDPATGVVRVLKSAAVNFESSSTRTLRIRATDRGRPPQFGEADLTIQLSDINEIPTITSSTLSIQENSSPGSVVGTILSTDPDANQSMLWTIQSGSGADSFEINAQTGQVKTKAGISLNFELKSSFDLVVRVSDSGSPPLSATAAVTIAVLDVNDPPAIAPKQFSIAESAAPGSLVGTVAFTDEDVNQTVVPTIVAGPNASRFSIDASGSIRLTSASNLDFETTPVLTIDVQATDSANPPASRIATMIIELTDVNEPPSVSTTSLSIQENSPPGTLVAKLGAIDPDANEVLTWSIVGQTPPWFAINAITGDLTVDSNAAIDFETKSSAELELKVSDAGGLSATRAFTVRVDDANEVPRLINPIPNATAHENVFFSLTIPDNTFRDEDAGDTLAYSIRRDGGFPLPPWLTFDTATRSLKGTPAAVNLGQLEVLVVAEDRMGKAASTPLVIDVVTSFTWHNLRNPFDVNNDTFVSAIDALFVINYLNQQLPTTITPGSNPVEGFLDTSRDNFVTPFDALLIINRLNQQSQGGEGEDAFVSELVEQTSAHRQEDRATRRDAFDQYFAALGFNEHFADYPIKRRPRLYLL